MTEVRTAAGSEAPVGIVANPASGKDIRRLVAFGSAIDNNEKVNILRRVLVGLDAVGVARVAYMPDTHALVARAAAGLDVQLASFPLPMPITGGGGDSLEASRRLAEMGAAAIVTLGGDGTNRLVAKGCGDIPLVPLSTGTNNVFPSLVEGTLAGLAAGLIATGLVPDPDGSRGLLRRHPRLDVLVDGVATESALIDVATTRHASVGSRAVWDPASLSEIVLSRVIPATIGLASLGGLLYPASVDAGSGVHVVLAANGRPGRRLLAPLAPGLVRPVPIERAALLPAGTTVSLRPGVGTVALDGEREFERPRSGASLAVRLDPAGPWVVRIGPTLSAAAAAGFFLRDLDDLD